MKRAALLAIVLGGCAETEFPTIGPDADPPSRAASYTISIVRFAKSRPEPTKNFVVGATDGETVAPVWLTWVLRGGGRTIVVDPGFTSDETARRLHAAQWTSPDALLPDVGVRPQDVTDVLVTRPGRSRMEALGRYPNARWWIESGAYEWARALRWASNAAGRDVPISAVELLERADDEGRLQRIDSTTEILPGIKAYSHHMVTPWQAYYAVRTKDGVWVIASDAAPLRQNLERNRLIPRTRRSVMLPAYANMRRIAGSTDRILPGVDPTFDRGAVRISDHAWRVGPQ